MSGRRTVADRYEVQLSPTKRPNARVHIVHPGWTALALCEVWTIYPWVEDERRRRGLARDATCPRCRSRFRQLGLPFPGRRRDTPVRPAIAAYLRPELENPWTVDYAGPRAPRPTPLVTRVAVSPFALTR